MLRLLGGLALEALSASCSGRLTQRRRLAVLATSPRRTIGQDGPVRYKDRGFLMRTLAALGGFATPECTARGQAGPAVRYGNRTEVRPSL
ncbi:MAG: hypothetical protein L0271_11320 [Gemmatimonadetes bacterium]|nr:hypothetical protein [Gemmatimonadota bacterium]